MNSKANELTESTLSPSGRSKPKKERVTTYKKRVAVNLYDENTYKALKHLCVDAGLSISDFIYKLLLRHMNNGDKDTIAPKTPTKVPEALESEGPIKDEEATFWQNQAKAFNNAMPLHLRPKKGPIIDPVEKSIKF